MVIFTKFFTFGQIFIGQMYEGVLTWGFIHCHPISYMYPGIFFILHQSNVNSPLHFCFFSSPCDSLHCQSPDCYPRIRCSEQFPFIIQALKNSQYLSSKKILCIVVLNHYTVYSTILNSLLTHRLQSKRQYSSYKSEFSIVDSLSNQHVIRSNERIENIWWSYKLHPCIRSTHTQNPVNIPYESFEVITSHRQTLIINEYNQTKPNTLCKSFQYVIVLIFVELTL